MTLSFCSFISGKVNVSALNLEKTVGVASSHFSENGHSKLENSSVTEWVVLTVFVAEPVADPWIDSYWQSASSF